MTYRADMAPFTGLGDFVPALRREPRNFHFRAIASTATLAYGRSSDWAAALLHFNPCFKTTPPPAPARTARPDPAGPERPWQRPGGAAAQERQNRRRRPTRGFPPSLTAQWAAATRLAMIWGNLPRAAGGAWGRFVAGPGTTCGRALPS